MNAKSQTATEYLIILAVVIVISLIVVGVLGGIPSIGGGLKERALVAKWQVKSPLSIDSWQAGKDFTVLDIKNTGVEHIKLDSFELANLNIDIGKTLTIGQKHRIKIPSTYRISQNGFKLHYTLGGHNYSAESDLGLNASRGSSLMEGLVGYWRFDQDLSDSSGNGFDGIASGNSSASNGVLKLDGDDDYVETSFSLGAEFQKTISLWFKVNSGVGANYSNNKQHTLIKAPILTWPASHMHISVRDRYDDIVSYVTDGTHHYSETLGYGFPVNINAGDWHHLGISYSSYTGVITFFYDGVQKVQHTEAQHIPIQYDALPSIGFGHSGSLSPNGAIDEVMIFDRLLSDSEMQNLFKAGR